MKLLDEIISLASSESPSVATLLRKCLILAHTLKNDHLKQWAENELNGYGGQDELPEYRKANITAKGLFLGPFNASINDQPLPSIVLKKEHRHWAETATLRQPIAAYESAKAASRMMINWPASLTALYERDFFEGDYALNRAWQELPGSVLVELIDTIKTRVLRFALDLNGQLEQVDDNPTELPKGKVEQTVINYILGGNNVIASSDFKQFGNVEIHQGDWQSLSNALTGELGVAPVQVAKLKSSLEADAKEAPGLGTRTASWLKEFAGTSGKAALKVAGDVAVAEARRWIFQHLGLPV